MKLPEGNGQAALLEVKSTSSQKVYVRIKDENGGWLKLINTAPSPGEANANISVEGEEIWCGITRDLEADTEIKLSDELRGTYHIIDSSEGRKNSISVDHRESSEKKYLYRSRSSDADTDESTEDSRPGSPEDGPKPCDSPSSHRNRKDSVLDADSRRALDGRGPSVDHHALEVSVKREVITPENCVAAVSDFEGSGNAAEASSHEDKSNHYSVLDNVRHVSVPVTFNGASPSITAGNSMNCRTTNSKESGNIVVEVNAGFSKSQDKRPGGGYVCIPCGIHFSSLDNLHAHQTIYCAHRVTKETNDELEDQSMVSPKSDSPDGSEKEMHSKNVKGESSFIGNTLLPKKRQRQNITNYHADSESVTAAAASGEINAQGDRKILKIGKLYRCLYCSYTSDKKSSLSRHLRMHGSPPPTTTSENAVAVHDLQSVAATPPLARYCSNCDIQFSSIRTYQVHKQYYCSTRHVQKATVATAPSASPMDLPGQEISPADEPPRFIQSNTTAPNVNEKETAATSGLPASGVLLQPPIFAAISTNPIVLVPCQILPNGGLVPATGIIPSSNILLPSRPASGTHMAESGAGVSTVNAIRPENVYPLYGGAEAASLPSLPVNGLIASHPKHEKVREQQESKSVSPTHTEISSSSKSMTNSSVSDIEKPLDLSVKKQHSKSPSESSGDRTPKKHRQSPSDKVPKSEATDDSNSAMDSSKVSLPPPPGSIVIPSGQILPAGLALPPGAIQSQVPGVPVVNPEGVAVISQVQPEVLVKQGTSKCKECNIVFYKYENYIAHKRHYCASRQQRMHSSRISASPPTGEKPVGKGDEMSGKEDSCDGLKPSSPTPGATSGTPLATTHSPSGSGSSNSHSPPLPQPVFQFYCVACGIKFTSLDNLQAHQTYYCPKRDILKVPPQGSSTGGGQTHKISELRCSKCKNSFATEEALKNHPCVIHRKCPYCDVTCPTLSAAQRHLVTHTGIHAFKCTICGYKGHTLRGMRTHIRIHLDKTNGAPEESFIACVDEEGSTISPFASRKRKNSDKARSEEQVAPSTSAASPGEATSSAVVPSNAASGDPTSVPSSGDSCDGKGEPALPPENAAETITIGEAIHWCQLCGYSSNYKGNVARHIKLVHKELSSQHAMSAVQTSSWLPLPTSSTQPRGPDTPPEDGGGGLVHGGKACSSPPLSECGPQDSMDSTSVSREAPSQRNQEASAVATAGEGDANSGAGSDTSTNVPKKGGPRYCRSCDITFKYLANFIAHKKHYCSSHTSSVSLPATDST